MQFFQKPGGVERRGVPDSAMMVIHCANDDENGVD
jgi:hypothetical protein